MSAMGAWGVGIFSNDDAADLREELRDLIADGHSANDATNKLVDDYGIGRGGVDDNDFWLGLAAAQHRIGHLGDGVLERALAIIDDPSELERWQPADRRRRRTVLDKLGEQLRQQAPSPKRLRPRRKVDTRLEAGQHVVFDTGTRRLLLRVERINEDKGGRYPVVVLLAWNGSERQLRKAHRLRGVEEPSPTREREWRGFTMIGEPLDPDTLQVLPCRADARTPSDWSSGWIVRWSQLEGFFEQDGAPRVP